jgi:hypothetical protein
MWNKSFAYFIPLFFLINCSASHKTFTEQEVILKKLSIEKYGTTFHLMYNTEKSYSVVVKQEKTTAQNPNPVLQFFVFDMGKEIIVFEDNVVGGRTSWKNNDQIEVVFTPGMISTEDNNKIYGYIYNVKLKTKTDINSSTQNPNH